MGCSYRAAKDQAMFVSRGMNDVDDKILMSSPYKPYEIYPPLTQTSRERGRFSGSAG